MYKSIGQSGIILSVTRRRISSELRPGTPAESSSWTELS